MVKRQTVLAMAVMAALLTPAFGGVSANEPQLKGQISGDYELKGTKTIDDTKNSLTIASTEKPKQDIIKVNENGSMTISGYKDLNFVDNLKDRNANTALLAPQGSEATVSATNINFGTKDKEFKAYQGFHAEGGTIDVKADNIYGNVKASGFLKAQNWDGGQAGSLTVHANQNVNLTSYAGELMTVDISHDSDIAIRNKLTADGNINLQVTRGQGKYTAVVDLSDSADGKGDANLTIDGKKGVSIIISEFGRGVSSQITHNKDAQNANVGTTTITSAEGDVNIQTKDEAIYSSTIVKRTDFHSNSTSKLDIAGNNVNLLSQGNTAISLSGNSHMTLQTNKDQGTISISGGNGIAASVGSGSTLNIGDANHDTTVNLKGQLVANGGTITVADKTTTVVDAASLKDKPLVSVTDGGKFTAEGNAKLVIQEATTGDTLYLYTKDDHQESPVDFWHTSFDNPFQYLDQDGKVNAGITDANKDGIVGYSVPTIAIAATNKNDKTPSSLLKTGKGAWNSAVGIGQVGGIQHSTYAVTGLFTDALSDHENTPAKDLWAKGFHSKENIDGLGFDGGVLSLDTQYNGTVVGMDVYQNENTTAGVAITYADGNISSFNGVSHTKNDATYLGASLYGLKDLGRYRLAADLSYVGGSHDITQHAAGQVITAKPDTEAWTLGVKALKDYDLGNGTLTPSVGLRYLRLTTDGYTSSVGLSYDKENQNLFLLPVGVDYSLPLKRGNWTLKPYTGVSYIWTMGDRNTDQTVSYGNVADTFSYDVSDAGSFLCKAGLYAFKGDYTFGIGYAYQIGSSVDSQTWTVQASYAF